MAKVWLKAGVKFSFSGGDVRVGASGTIVDSSIDWTVSSQHNEEPDRIGQIVGEGLFYGGEKRSQLTFSVYLDDETGRLWYDDANGY